MSKITNKGKGNVLSRDDWQTPQELFNALNEQYLFTYDCCAKDDGSDSKCDAWCFDFLEEDNLRSDDTCWMNPPFSKAREMFEHYFKIVPKGVCIFRCDNMETKTWQIILKHANWILIPPYRINYEGKTGGGAVFPSALIGYNIETPIYVKGTILRVEEIIK